jgi:hypothetical protein
VVSTGQTPESFTLNQNFLANGRQLDFIRLCDFWHKSGYILPSQSTTRRFLGLQGKTVARNFRMTCGKSRRADFQMDGGRFSGCVGTHIFPIAIFLCSQTESAQSCHMADGHEHFHFSVTIQSEELFMVSAMRRLAWQFQPQINRRIATAGTGNDQWKRNQGRATFYFTSTANRTEFLGELSRIFPTGWEKIGHDEKRMAPRQN